MALRDQVKKTRSSGGSLRAAAKGRPKPSSAAATPEAPTSPEQATQAMRQPIPPIPEPFEYVRYLSRIPGLRKMTQ